MKTFPYTWTYAIAVMQAVIVGGLLSIDWMTLGLHIDQPNNLRWLLAIPVLTMILIGHFHWKWRMTQNLGDSALIRAMAANHSNQRQLARGILMLSAIGFFILAMARPQWGQTDQMIKRSGIDVVFALDLSKSMLARDTPPSRLQAAKQEIRTTLEMLKGDRVGLVVFTAVSFAQSPLTADYGALRFYLRKLKPDQMPFGGTSIGRAIHDSVELLTGTKQQGVLSNNQNEVEQTSTTMKRAKTQLIVLITDGEDHESDPINAAKFAQSQNIHIVTVGFGSSQGERIPMYRDDGSLNGYKRNKKGEFVYTRLDTKMMEEIADKTNGIFLPYKGQNSVANGLIEYINALEKSELQALMRRRYKERFMWFLIPGILLMLLSMFLGERKKTNRAAMVATMVMTLLVGLGCEDAFRYEQSDVQRGNEAIEKKQFSDALKHYREAEKQLPATPQLHYNLGRAHFGLEQWDKAQEYFARALETQDDTLRFKSLYNLGLTLAKKQSWEESYQTLKQSIELYHKGLSAQTPEAQAAIASVYKDAVHNLEVVYNKLYPPCKTFEDQQEENDSPNTAKTIEQNELKSMTLCGRDDDWFVIPVLVGTQVDIKVTFKNLRDKPDPEQAFLARGEDLRIALFDGTGTKALVVDQGANDNVKWPLMANAKPTITRHLSKLTVTPEMLPEDTKALLLKISAADRLEFQYDINITSIPPCSSLDDKYEQNNDAKQAKHIKPGSEQLHLCAQDEDWYSVDLQLGDTFFVDVQPSEDVEKKTPPQLSVEVYRASNGKLVARGKPESGLLTTGLWNVTKPGKYHIRVRGKDAQQQGPYAMQTYLYAPCSAGGDDRYEDNDEASSASLLNPQAPMHRYLRICPEDGDFYRLPMAPIQKDKDDKRGKKTKADEDKQKLALGLSVVKPPGMSKKDLHALIHQPEHLPFSLMSPGGDQIVKESEPVVVPVASKEKKQTKDPKDQSIVIHKVLQAPKVETPQALVRVQSTTPELFYHIVQLNPQSQENDKQKQKDDNKEKEDKNKDKKDKPKDEQNKEQSPKQEDQQPKEDKGNPDSKDEQKKDDKGKGEQKDKDQKPDEQGKKDEQEGKKGDPKKEKTEDDGQSQAKKQDDTQQKGQPKGAQKAQKDPEMKRIKDVLRALEETDDNFQMRKALENTPGRYIEKDW